MEHGGDSAKHLRLDVCAGGLLDVLLRIGHGIDDPLTSAARQCHRATPARQLPASAYLHASADVSLTHVLADRFAAAAPFAADT